MVNVKDGVPFNNADIVECKLLFWYTTIFNFFFFIVYCMKIVVVNVCFTFFGFNLIFDNNFGGVGKISTVVLQEQKKEIFFPSFRLFWTKLCYYEGKKIK